MGWSPVGASAECGSGVESGSGGLRFEGMVGKPLCGGPAAPFLGDGNTGIRSGERAGSMRGDEEMGFVRRRRRTSVVWIMRE